MMKSNIQLYQIPANSHRSGYFFSPVWKPGSFTLRAFFSKQCFYDPYEYGFFINKIGGISYSLPSIKNGRITHVNSIRVGFRPTIIENSLNPIGLEIIVYAYVGGFRIEKPIAIIESVTESVIVSFDFDELSTSKQLRVYTYVLKSIDHYKHILLQSKADTVNDIIPLKRGCIGYRLYPYIGGFATLPFDVSLFVDFYNKENAALLAAHLVKYGDANLFN